MITPPHTSDPIVSDSGEATFEMRGWMERVSSDIDTYTTTTLNDESSQANTTNKAQFKIVGNTTTGRLIYAAGSATTSLWLYFDGTTAHTPS